MNDLTPASLSERAKDALLSRLHLPYRPIPSLPSVLGTADVERAVDFGRDSHLDLHDVYGREASAQNLKALRAWFDELTQAFAPLQLDRLFAILPAGTDGSVKLDGRMCGLTGMVLVADYAELPASIRQHTPSVGHALSADLEGNALHLAWQVTATTAPAVTADPLSNRRLDKFVQRGSQIGRNFSKQIGGWVHASGIVEIGFSVDPTTAPAHSFSRVSAAGRA